jgi:GNAT superfamily N-acetyltransferase
MRVDRVSERRRHRLVAPLAREAVETVMTGAPRYPTRTDVDALASLMLEAYCGTIDEEGETLADAILALSAYFAGVDGEPLLECSFVADDGLQPVTACLISLYHGEPLLAYAFTTPSAQGRGLSTGLIRLSMQALEARGHLRLGLFVTIGNTTAEHIYEKLGFRPETGGPS